MKRTLLAMAVIVLLAGTLGAARKALVIGNAAYAGKQALTNPLNDAKDLADVLRELGFSVSTANNCDLRALKESIDTFTRELSPADEVVFYYSGHGAQSSGENYLIPIGATIADPVDYPYETVSASWALQRMAPAKLTIFILDACRNDPVTRSWGSSKGLAKLEPQNGSQYVIYATEKDTEAQDGKGRNSPFAESLVRNLRTSPKKIEDMMKDVRADVRRATNNLQNPTAYGILDMDFYFNASAAPLTPTTTTNQNAPQPGMQVVQSYGSIRVSTDKEADAYLDGSFMGKVPEASEAVFSNVAVGNHTVEMRQGNDKQNISVRVEKDSEVLAAFTFIKVPDNMVLVEGGTFMMGSNDGYDDEKPVHQVTVSSFMIGEYELTVGEFRAFVNASGYKTIAETSGGGYVVSGDKWEQKADANWKNPYISQTDEHPVTCVSWYDAIAYCNWLSRRDGLSPCYSISGNTAPTNWNSGTVDCNWSANGYRLPTEAEWEYAARGGNKSKGYTYSGSNDVGSVAWYWDNAGEATHAVGGKSPNELGIYDMSGNVWEWCWDWYSSYASASQNNPTGATSGDYRVLRGGSWDNNVSFCRVANRYFGDPGYWYYYYYGLRVLRATK